MQLNWDQATQAVLLATDDPNVVPLEFLPRPSLLTLLGDARDRKPQVQRFKNCCVFSKFHFEIAIVILTCIADEDCCGSCDQL